MTWVLVRCDARGVERIEKRIAAFLTGVATPLSCGIID